MRDNDNSTVIARTIADYAPVLSAPYLHLQDAIDCAPQRALILLDTASASYQYMRIGDEHTCFRHVQHLVNWLQQATDLVCVAWNIGQGWDFWRDSFEVK